MYVIVIIVGLIFIHVYIEERTFIYESIIDLYQRVMELFEKKEDDCDGKKSIS